MEELVAPLDHVLPFAEEEVSTTLPPSQKIVDPATLITGAAVTPGSVSTCTNVLELQPSGLKKVTE